MLFSPLSSSTGFWVEAKHSLITLNRSFICNTAFLSCSFQDLLSFRHSLFDYDTSRVGLPCVYLAWLNWHFAVTNGCLSDVWRFQPFFNSSFCFFCFLHLLILQFMYIWSLSAISWTFEGLYMYLALKVYFFPCITWLIKNPFSFLSCPTQLVSPSKWNFHFRISIFQL